ncbi:MAG: hypothetical protein CL685_00580 [Candidatus Magasanikbacteria bacterium]|nr:hypothetical protein [Candidatus Magasanikbacteria bacterium]|tara:strand:+ start:812 stop:1525 length:714 start_codon:yes stop_codon:yes gene_type:complete
MITRNYFRFKKIHYFFYATLCICAFFAIQYTALAITDPAIQKAIDQANTHLKAAQDAARDIPRFATKETANTTYKRFEAELELAEKWDTFAKNNSKQADLLEVNKLNIETKITALRTKTSASFNTLSDNLPNRCAAIKGLLPQCALDGNCLDTDDYVCMGINISKLLLQLIGSIAFVMFLFGGFTMIMSFGNPEKFKKGRSIMVLAVVGIVVALSAHLIVDLILDTLGTHDSFRAVK